MQFAGDRTTTCYANRHMTATEFAVWTLASRLAHSRGGILNYSGRELAKMFIRLDKDSVYRALKTLADAGWLQQVRPSQMRGKNSTAAWFRVLDHQEWAASHPAECCTLAELSDDPGDVGHTDPDSTVALDGQPCRSGDTVLSPRSDTTVANDGHSVKQVPDVKEAAACSLLPPPPLASDGQRLLANTHMPIVANGGQPQSIVANGGQHPNLREFRAFVQDRVPDVELVDEPLDEDALAVLNCTSLQRLKAASIWAWQTEFWPTRGVLNKRAVKNLLNNFQTIQGQMEDDAKRKGKAMGKAAIFKAESVRPDPAKPFVYEGVQA